MYLKTSYLPCLRMESRYTVTSLSGRNPRHMVYINITFSVCYCTCAFARDLKFTKPDLSEPSLTLPFQEKT